VYAQGKRDGLENCIYDPLIVMLLARHAQSQFKAMGISNKTTDTELVEKSEAELQDLVDKVQAHVLGPMATNGTVTAVRYCGRLTLNIRNDYTLCDDHDLVKKIEAKFVSL
jgi:predicted lactoylglutathione lyase